MQKHMRWLSSQAPPNGSVPATTSLSYAGRPWEPLVQAGHAELHQQHHLDTQEVQRPVRNQFLQVTIN
ncbi:MAG: hypothetical protein ACK56F_31880, partial [bacterium]